MNNTTAAANKVEIVRTGNGQFDVYLNGEKTKYQIVNGSLGMSGRNTANVYGIYNGEKDSVRWFGPLRTCKSAVAFTLTKNAKAGWVDAKEIPTPKYTL